MNKAEELYRLNKARSTLTDYTTLDETTKLEIVLEETLKILESVITRIDK